MGTRKMINSNKKYFIISGLDLDDNNRGTAALGYGAFSFLQERGYINEKMTLLRIDSTITSKGKRSESRLEKVRINGCVWNYQIIAVNPICKKILQKTGFTFPGTTLHSIIKNISFVAAINGGDGFSDIYGTRIFYSRLPLTLMAMKAGIPVIQLPQTLGPFENDNNYELAKNILQYSSHVYIRDDKFVPELKNMGVKFELTNDLSFFMKPEPWDIKIERNAIGINVSGLAYSNSFNTLSGQFDLYPELIDKLIKHFQQKGNTIYLIPHSYHYGTPEPNNDDLEACKSAYERLENKSDVVLIDKDIISPKVKYLISQMKFFIGTRMHANYAAIFTNVPLFGLAYSYKFQGAFEHNGIYNRTTMIKNITSSDIDSIISQIENAYVEDVANKEK